MIEKLLEANPAEHVIKGALYVLMQHAFMDTILKSFKFANGMARILTKSYGDDVSKNRMY
jgi:hypothetical protein